MKAERPALPRTNDVLVDRGAAAPKLCLSTVEMRTLTATGGLYFPSAKSLQRRVSYFTSRLFGSARPKR